jgi:hypothetical protein
MNNYHSMNLDAQNKILNFIIDYIIYIIKLKAFLFKYFYLNIIKNLKSNYFLSPSKIKEMKKQAFNI